jgi:hypothetical protein
MKTFLLVVALLLLAVAGPTGSDKVADPKAPSIAPQRAHAAGAEKHRRSTQNEDAETLVMLVLYTAGTIVFGYWLLDFKDRLENPQRRVVR